MLGALAVGQTEISGLLEGEDVLATAAAVNALGAHATRAGDGRWTVNGVGIGGLAEPDDLLDLGNSGTAARLLLGILATHPITAFVTGDASLRRRPMGRVVEPLSRFGARFVTREGARLPLVVSGAADPLPISYRLPVPSAQIKSSVLLAGLNTPGATTVIEPADPRPLGAHACHFCDGGERARRRRWKARHRGRPSRTGRSAHRRTRRPLGRVSADRGADCSGPELHLAGRTRCAAAFECLREMGTDIDLLNERDEGASRLIYASCRH
jgi:3-phosphoshikimate 1-carboxyvinyltransferase